MRGKTFEAIEKVNKNVNRALCGAALSLNNNIEIVDIPGYSPLLNDKNMMQLAKDAADAIIPEVEFAIRHNAFSKGSTDMGDLSSIMPVVHPYASGVRGTGHGNDYEVFDPESACVKNSKWQVAMVTLLLQDDAARAKQILEEFKPIFPSKEAFLAYQDSLNCEGDRITYREDGVAEIRL